jgi:hypothetical protein
MSLPLAARIALASGLALAMALFAIVSLERLSNAKADDLTPQLIQTIDLNTTTANLSVIGAASDDHLSGSDDPNTFSIFPRAGSIATGDVNGDNILDLIIGAPDVDFTPAQGNARPNAGAVYIVLGRQPFANPTLIDTNLAASNLPDVRIFGLNANDRLGFAVASGDVNGDGISDVLMGAPGADFNATPRNDTGAVFVIFGSNTLTNRTIDLATQPSPASVTIFGSRAGDEFGSAIAVGNVGGPNTTADILIGAPGNDGIPNNLDNAGIAYVVFGSDTIAGQNGIIDLGSANAPVRLLGRAGMRLGSSVAIGDVNSGGSPDLIVGAPRADRPATPTDIDETGGTFVVFGGTNLDPIAPATTRTFDLNSVVPADRPNVSIYGAAANDHQGASVSASDVTGDGTTDLILGAPDADGRNDALAESGEVYVLEGGTALNPPQGSTERVITISVPNVRLTVYGAASGDHLGSRVRGALINTTGNNDTISDLLMGAPGFDAPNRSNAGKVSILFGGQSLLRFAEIDLALGQDDIRVLGQAADDELGWAIAGADIDNNNGGDLIVGAPFNDIAAPPAPARTNAGRVYALLATANDIPPVNANPTVTVTAPNGTENVPGGSQFNITWTASDPNGDATIQRFEIRLSTDAGQSFNTIIATNVPGDSRSFAWTVPLGLNTTTARIRVIAFDNAGGQGQDESNANFTISDVGVTVTLTTPNGGERLTFGQVFTIQWAVPANLASQVTGFDLFLSTNGGTSFNVPIAFTGPLQPALPTGARDFAWTVPSICTDTARVLVTARLNSGATSIDTSNANFSISAPGPSLDPARLELNESRTKLTLRTTPPATGTEVRFVEGVTVEISNEAGTLFFQPNKIKFKGNGAKIQTKGNFNGQPFSTLFPDGATRTLRITNPPCGILVFRARREGGRLVVVTTAQSDLLIQPQVIWP